MEIMREFGRFLDNRFTALRNASVSERIEIAAFSVFFGVYMGGFAYANFMSAQGSVLAQFVQLGYGASLFYFFTRFLTLGS